jgi:hypothetical protein
VAKPGGRTGRSTGADAPRLHRLVDSVTVTWVTIALEPKGGLRGL